MPVMTPLRAYALSMTPPSVPDSTALRSRRSRLHKRGDHSLCRHEPPRVTPCGLGWPEGDPAEALEAWLAKVERAREARERKSSPCRSGDHRGCDPEKAGHGACSECGKTIQVSNTSAAPERRRCRDCQRANPRPRFAALVPQSLNCPTCGTSFTQRRAGQKYCCVEHRPPRPGTRTAGRVAASRRRRLRVATTWDGVTDAEILERDRWMCGICRKRIGKAFRYPHPRSASIDHVMPLSEGGDDTAANKRAAHLGCNIQRSNRGGNEQLALIG